MNKINYFEKLKDPRWQRKRLEAMEAAEFTCELCGDSESTLNVHHKSYLKGRDPWEYSIGQLSVLCERCHKDHHSQESFIKVITSFVSPEDEYEAGSLISGYLGLDPNMTIFNDENVDDDEYQTTPSADHELYQIGILAAYFYKTFNPDVIQKLLLLINDDPRALSDLVHSYVDQNT